MSLNKQKFLMSTPAITRKYTPGSRRNSRKPMRLPPRRETRPVSAKFGAEQFLVPNQTHKEPRFAWRNSRETPNTLTHLEVH